MIEINHVDKWYGPNFQALKDCTTSVAKGEVVVVCGPSGSGKSTLIKCVNALEPFQGGEIILDGIKVNDPKTDLPKLRARVGMVFQHFELFPHLRIIDNLCLAQEKVLGRGHDEALAKGAKLLDRVGLNDHARKYPAELSGGQQQRVAIARALAVAPRVMLFDEPTFGARSRACRRGARRHSRLGRGRNDDDHRNPRGALCPRSRRPDRLHG
jgi:glutamate/aspartate transport system ATP-binding protein